MWQPTCAHGEALLVCFGAPLQILVTFQHAESSGDVRIDFHVGPLRKLHGCLTSQRNWHRGIQHQMLNARPQYIRREAKIIAQVMFCAMHCCVKYPLCCMHDASMNGIEVVSELLWNLYLPVR